MRVALFEAKLKLGPKSVYGVGIERESKNH